jgi:hypothetical protein
MPSASPAKPFPFLLLPPELRNEVYRLLFDPLKESERFANRSSIAAVCRQIHDEVIPYLYSLHFFAHPNLLTDFPYFCQYGNNIWSPRYLPLIRNWRLNVRLDCDPKWSKDDVTKAFSGMQSLTVNFWVASFRAGDLNVLERFSGIRGVVKANVTGAVPPDVATWLMAAMESPADGVVGVWENITWNAWEDANR